MPNIMNFMCSQVSPGSETSRPDCRLHSTQDFIKPFFLFVHVIQAGSYPSSIQIGAIFTFFQAAQSSSVI